MITLKWSNNGVNLYVFEMYIQQNSPYPDAGYPDRLGSSGKHFLTVTVLHILWFKFFSQSLDTYKEFCINVSFVSK